MSALDALAARVEAGASLSEAEARLVLGTRDLIAAGTIADALRRRLHGRRTTFLRVLDVHVDAVPAALPAGAAPGEIRLVGEVTSLEALLAAVAATRALGSGVPVTALDADGLVGLAAASGLSIQAVASQLSQAGLAGLTDVAVDGQADPVPVIEAARAGGLRVLRLTRRRVADDPLAGASTARALQNRLGGFEAFAPLPRDVRPDAPTTGYDDVKTVAASRLLVSTVPSIQVDWTRYGPKLAQVALTAGADDVDGVAAVDAGLGPRRTPLEEIRRNVRAAGQEPIERSGLFDALPAGPESAA